MFPEGDLLLRCLLGHCEGRHELLQGQVKEVPRVRDDAEAIARGDPVEHAKEGWVHFKVEVVENDGVLLNAVQCQLGQFGKAGAVSPHILETASTFLPACPLQVVVNGEDDEELKQLMQCAREFCRVATKGHNVANHQQQQRHIAEPLDVRAKEEG